MKKAKLFLETRKTVKFLSQKLKTLFVNSKIFIFSVKLRIIKAVPLHAIIIN